MTRPEFDVKEEYLGDGSNDTYTFDFKIEQLGFLLSILIDEEGKEVERGRGDLPSFIDSVTFNPINGGGSVKLSENLPTDYRLILVLANDEPTQPAEWKNKRSFDLAQLERDLDFLGGGLQSVAERTLRSFKIHEADNIENIDTTLPIGFEGAANRVLMVDSTGQGLVYGPTADEISGAQESAENAAAAQQAAAESQASALAAQEAAEIAQGHAEAAQLAAEEAEANAQSALGDTETARDEAVGAALSIVFQFGTQSIGNNQTDVNVSDAELDPMESTAYKFEYQIRRKTDSNKVFETGCLRFVYDDVDNVWIWGYDSKISNAGAVFNMSGNQLRVSSSNIAGDNYEDEIGWKIWSVP